jgi:hypothetical protein
MLSSKASGCYPAKHLDTVAGKAAGYGAPRMMYAVLGALTDSIIECGRHESAKEALVPILKLICNSIR